MAVKKKEYYQGKGGRKSAGARVRVFPGKKGIEVNGIDFKEYFPIARHQRMVLAPLEVSEMQDAVGVTVHVKGSGKAGQAGAVRHGIAHALVNYNEELRKKLKKKGFMSRDSRVVERKKPGLKKARRAPQWSKR
ncbi:MAG: 30S ribosomal protein S9 [bacterium]|nr:30S ribosomal protein S9 [bacterium]